MILCEETHRSTVISSDEELKMLRSPKVFPVVNIAEMGVGFRCRRIELIDTQIVGRVETKGNEDSSYIKYAINRNQIEEREILEYRKLMNDIRKAHKAKMNLRMNNSKNIRAILLNCVNKAKLH